MNHRLFALLILAGGTLGAPLAHAGSPEVAGRIAASLNLKPGDADALLALDVMPPQYAPMPGHMEFSGALIVRPVQPADGALARGAADLAAQRLEAIDRLAPITLRVQPETDHYIVRVPEGVSENELSAFLMATGQYEYAEPDWIVFPARVPNDTNYGSQYAHQRMNTEPAWDLTTGSTSVTIAITDTGIRLDHVDLVSNLVSGANSASGTAVAQSSGGAVNDLNGHGTHCAGIAGASGNNALLVAGVNWNSRLMPVRVSDLSSGNSSLSALQAGALWAAQNGARIVSTSYSGVNTSSNNTTGGTMINTWNSLWFWAAGNAGSDLGADNYPNLIVVGSTNSSDAKVSSSNFGAALDVMAPGDAILSTWLSSSTATATLGGTSMACPAAAGVAGLILSVNPSFTATQVRTILFNNVDDLGTAGEDNTFGRGRVNAGRAVADAYRIAFPRTLPFSDDFETTTFDVTRWVYRDTGVAANTGAVAEPSGVRSAAINVARRLESNAINLAGNSQPIELRFATQARGPASTESLIVEYLNSSSVWTTLATITTPGGNQSVFTQQLVSVPNIAAARHAKFAVRFRATGNASSDLWYVDDVSIAVPCASDYDGSGFADSDDFVLFVDHFERGCVGAGTGASGADAGCTKSADFDASGFVDSDDFIAFAQAFNAGC